MYAVLSRPVEGREDAYVEWYTGRHLDDVLREAGFERAGLWRLVGTNPPAAAPAPYLALYEIDTDDIEAVNAAMARAARHGTLPLSDALDMGSVVGMWFESVRDRHAGD